MAHVCQSRLAKQAAAAVHGIVAVVLLSWAPPTFAQDAGGDEARLRAAELLIARGDVNRLAEQNLPDAHRTGLLARIQGSLGLLPWMLRRAGDQDGGDRLRQWQGQSLDGGQGEVLATLLQALSRHHALNVADFENQPDTPTTRREARAIHIEYCAGCHDDQGDGDPDLDLPARDLFRMAQQEPPELVLARLVMGVKGTAEIQFANPLTDQQIAALWRFYLKGVQAPNDR